MSHHTLTNTTPAQFAEASEPIGGARRLLVNLGSLPAGEVVRLVGVNAKRVTVTVKR